MFEALKHEKLINIVWAYTSLAVFDFIENSIIVKPEIIVGERFCALPVVEHSVHFVVELDKPPQQVHRPFKTWMPARNTLRPLIRFRCSLDLIAKHTSVLRKLPIFEHQNPPFPFILWKPFYTFRLEKVKNRWWCLMTIDNIVTGEEIAAAINRNRAGKPGVACNLADWSDSQRYNDSDTPWIDADDYAKRGKMRQPNHQGTRYQLPASNAERTKTILGYFGSFSVMEVQHTTDEEGAKFYNLNGRFPPKPGQEPVNPATFVPIGQPLTVASLAMYMMQQGKRDPRPPTEEAVVQYVLENLSDLVHGENGPDLRTSYQALFDPTSYPGGNAPHGAHRRAKGSHVPGQRPETPAASYVDPASDKPTPGTHLAGHYTPLELVPSRPFLR